MIQRRENTASILTALGELPPNATPAQRQAAVNALTDAEINDRCDELLARLGAPGYRQQAAA
jgi:hypothetical protein